MSFDIVSGHLSTFSQNLAKLRNKVMETLLQMEGDALCALATRARLIGAPLDLMNPKPTGVLRELLNTVERRALSKNKELPWERVEASYLDDSKSLKALIYAEKIGASPFVMEPGSLGFLMVDGYEKIPKMRAFRSFDEQAADWWQDDFETWWDARQKDRVANGLEEESKEGLICNGPAISKEEAKLGFELLSPEFHEVLVQLGFDRNTFTWLETPKVMREEDGWALVGGSTNNGKPVVERVYAHNTSPHIGARLMKRIPWGV